jgi:hypothetical protein
VAIGCDDSGLAGRVVTVTSNVESGSALQAASDCRQLLHSTLLRALH